MQWLSKHTEATYNKQSDLNILSTFITESRGLGHGSVTVIDLKLLRGMVESSSIRMDSVAVFEYKMFWLICFLHPFFFLVIFYRKFKCMIPAAP